MKKIKSMFTLMLIYMLLNTVSFADVVVGPISYNVFMGYRFLPLVVGVVLATILLGVMLYSTLLMLKKALDIEQFPDNIKKYKSLKEIIIVVFVLLYGLSLFFAISRM